MADPVDDLWFDLSMSCIGSKWRIKALQNVVLKDLADNDDEWAGFHWKEMERLMGKVYKYSSAGDPIRRYTTMLLAYSALNMCEKENQREKFEDHMHHCRTESNGVTTRKRIGNYYDAMTGLLAKNVGVDPMVSNLAQLLVEDFLIPEDGILEED